MYALKIETMCINVRSAQIVYSAIVNCDPDSIPNYRWELLRDWTYELFANDGTKMRTIPASRVDFTRVMDGSIEFDVTFQTAHDFGVIRRISEYGIFLDVAVPVSPFVSGIVKPQAIVPAAAGYMLIRRATFYDYVETVGLGIAIAITILFIVWLVRRNANVAKA